MTSLGRITPATLLPRLPHAVIKEPAGRHDHRYRCRPGRGRPGRHDRSGSLNGRQYRSVIAKQSTRIRSRSCQACS
jgi:hypothetical protein